MLSAVVMSVSSKIVISALRPDSAVVNSLIRKAVNYFLKLVKPVS